MPCRSHRRHVIEHVAFRLFDSSEIRDHLGRFHYYLAQKQHAGTYDLTHHPQHTHNVMHLRKVAAVRPQLLPDIGNRINADNIHPPVGQVEEIVHHLIEHPGIPVV